MSYGHIRDLHNSTFFGLPVQQYWADLALWEHFLNAEGHQDIKTIVEMGTCKCGMSIFLLGQCIQRDMLFWTIDRDEPEEMRSHIARTMGLGLRFIHGDFWFGEANMALIKLLNDDELHPLMLFVDGGDKAKELQAFVPRLRPGDYVAVHDYGTEFDPRAVEPVQDMLEELFFDECNSIDPCITRFWRITNE